MKSLLGCRPPLASTSANAEHGSQPGRQSWEMWRSLPLAWDWPGIWSGQASAAWSGRIAGRSAAKPLQRSASDAIAVTYVDPGEPHSRVALVSWYNATSDLGGCHMDRSQAFGRNMRDHRVPMALVGIGLGWLLTSSLRDPDRAGELQGGGVTG